MGVKDGSLCTQKQPESFVQFVTLQNTYCKLQDYNCSAQQGGLRCVLRLHTIPCLLAFAPLQMLPRAAGKQAGGQTTVRAEPVTTTLDSNMTETYTAELNLQPLQQQKGQGDSCLAWSDAEHVLTW